MSINSNIFKLRLNAWNDQNALPKVKTLITFSFQVQIDSNQFQMNPNQILCHMRINLNTSPNSNWYLSNKNVLLMIHFHNEKYKIEYLNIFLHIYNIKRHSYAYLHISKIPNTHEIHMSKINAPNHVWIN